MQLRIPLHEERAARISELMERDTVQAFEMFKVANKRLQKYRFQPHVFPQSR
jgi:hypothetical protein